VPKVSPELRAAVTKWLQDKGPWTIEFTGTFSAPTGAFAADSTVKKTAKHLAQNVLRQHVTVAWVREWTTRRWCHVHALFRLTDTDDQIQPRRVIGGWDRAHFHSGYSKAVEFDPAHDFIRYMTKHTIEVEFSVACPDEGRCRRNSCLSQLWR